MRGFWQVLRSAGEVISLALLVGMVATGITVADDPAARGTIAGAEQPLVERGRNLAAQPAIVSTEFIYETAPFPQCHASTIESTADGLVAAWFGGTREKNPDVGIWVSRHDGKSWSAPVEVADGVQDATTRHPCWNPVLFQMPGGPLLLFYKVGPSPSTWWGMLMQS